MLLRVAYERIAGGALGVDSFHVGEWFFALSVQGQVADVKIRMRVVRIAHYRVGPHSFRKFAVNGDLLCPTQQVDGVFAAGSSVDGGFENLETSIEQRRMEAIVSEIC